MSTKKSRDLAQELVDFLLKEEKQNKGPAPAPANVKEDNRAKPQLVSPFSVKAPTTQLSKEAPPSTAAPLPKVASSSKRPPEKPFEELVVQSKGDLPQSELAPGDGADKTFQITDEKPTFEQPTFVSSIDVRVPDMHTGTKKRDPRLPDPDKTEVQRPEANLPSPEFHKNGLTAIEFNIDDAAPTHADINFVGSSEKAKEILSEIVKLPLNASDAKNSRSATKAHFESSLDIFRESSPKPATKSTNVTVEAREDGAGDRAGSSPSLAPPSAVVPMTEAREATQFTKSQAFSSQRSRVVVNEVTQLMAGAEAVKVAQARISSLESERDELRSETEELLSTTETLQRRFNGLKAQHDTLERKHKERIEILEDEKAVIRTRLTAKEEELDRIKKENEDLQLRFKNDLRKIRVRERELEHRQEIMKAEHATVVHSKDEMIIELKRTLERLHFELDNFRAKSADMNTKINEFYERNHRTVKALRLALSVLETGDNEEKPKKASG